jgi:hypothetical protein
MMLASSNTHFPSEITFGTTPHACHCFQMSQRQMADRRKENTPKKLQAGPLQSSIVMCALPGICDTRYPSIKVLQNPACMS